MAEDLLVEGEALLVDYRARSGDEVVGRGRGGKDLVGLCAHLLWLSSTLLSASLAPFWLSRRGCRVAGALASGKRGRGRRWGFR